MRWRPWLLAFALLGLVFLAGCTDEPAQPPSDGDEDGANTYERCDTVTVPYEVNGTEWAAARVACEANVTGTNEETLSCAEPEEATLTASANLTGGEVELRVDDGEGTVAEHRLADTGGEPRNLTIEAGAQAGEWTLAGERLEGFEGSYRAELACPQ